MSNQLSTFLDFFPRNTIVLSLFEWADSSLRVVDDTRQLLYDKVLIKDRDCVSSRVFSIQHESRKGNTNSTQAAFEHALSTDICQSAAGVWVSYIQYCHSQRQLRAKAKDIYYRALRNCPWSKDVMMEAFATLIRDMKSEELRAVYDTMLSKGLRIHQDLDEFLETWKKI